MRNKKQMYPQYFLLPALIIYTLLVLIPSFSGFYFGFTNWNSMRPVAKWIGLKNFINIFSNSSGMGHVFLNTTIYAVFTTVFKLILGLVLALLLNKKLRTRNVLRAIYFLPMMLATVALGIVFTEILKPSGLLNTFLGSIGLASLQRQWTQDPSLCIWSLASIEVWRASGFAMVIFLAALQAVPQELYESVEMDGAGPWNTFAHITLPNLLPAIEVNVSLGLISGFKAFDLILVVTNGGPGHASEVLNVSVYNEFSKGLYGYSTAMSVVLFIIITAVYLAVNRIFRKAEVDL